jgi:hypothetical protein
VAQRDGDALNAHITIERDISSASARTDDDAPARRDCGDRALQRVLVAARDFNFRWRLPWVERGKAIPTFIATSIKVRMAARSLIRSLLCVW